jgi:hypothetical protein
VTAQAQEQVTNGRLDQVRASKARPPTASTSNMISPGARGSRRV